LVETCVFHAVDHMEHLNGCLVTDLVDVVVAKFEGDGKDVLENGLGLVDSREDVELSGYFVTDAPFLGVLLEYQKDVDQVLTDRLFEQLHKLRDV
jgi:hypothetical protein